MAEYREKHFLDQVIHLCRWNAGQKNAVDHTGVTIVELAERSAISFLGSSDQGATSFSSKNASLTQTNSATLNVVTAAGQMGSNPRLTIANGASLISGHNGIIPWAVVGGVDLASYVVPSGTTPNYTAGMIFLLLENHKILLDLHHSERNNRQMAHHDLLTGLPNRALNLKLFSELLDGPWPEAGTPVSKLTVFCLDLDGFKSVNDRFGHAAGDAVLVAVAKRLRASVRDADYVCRLGGDEFVILLPNITDGEAADVARRIVSRISEPFEFDPAARVGASIGLASAPRDGTTADELLSAADRAMYEAKRRGKGGFVIHSPGAEIAAFAPMVKAPALAC